uniref:PLAC8 family protein n=1 Tax=Gouania willdenowi TaxID=441366 RepID=A0A8C5DIR6_GOUWI
RPFTISMAQHQHTAQTPLIDFNTGLFGCFEDGCWCCPCLACTVSGRFGENICLPLCDIITLVCFSACGIPLFVPPAGVTMTASMRNRYGIKLKERRILAVLFLLPFFCWYFHTLTSGSLSRVFAHFHVRFKRHVM